MKEEIEREIEKELIKFNLERLKGKKVAVNCKTEEQFQDFVDWVKSLGKDLDNDNEWEDYKEDTCLRLCSNLTWDYYDIKGLRKIGYEIISYEEALLKESKEHPKETTEVVKLQKKITNLQHSLRKKDEKIKNQALEINSLLSQKQHLQQQLDSEVSVKEKYSKSLIIIEYLENKLSDTLK